MPALKRHNPDSGEWEYVGPDATFPLNNVLAGSLLRVSGHSGAASGGASGPQRGWANILAALLRAQDWSIARGGGVLGWHEAGQPNFWANSLAQQPGSGATGDGGWGNFLQNNPIIARGVTWRGLWNAGVSYYPGQGVYTGAGARWFVARTNNLAVDPPTDVAASSTNWREITGPDSAGRSSWQPMPGLHISWFGNNDLGWGKEYAFFEQHLDLIMARAFSARVFEDTSPMITYTGFTPTNVFAAQYNSGSTLQAINTMVVGNSIDSHVPVDWPGGKIRFGFTHNPAQTKAGKLMIVLDGVDQREIDFTVERQYTASRATPKLAGWVETLEVPAGHHTLSLRCTANCGVANSFDYISFDTPRPIPHVFLGLFKPLSYTAWTVPYPTDADVDTWNANIKNFLAANYPSVLFIDPTESLTPGDTSLFIHDLLHPNDDGHAKIALQVYNALANHRVDGEIAALLSREPQSGSQLFFAKYGNQSGNFTVINDGTWQDVVVAGRNVEGYIAAQPGDLLEIVVSGLWNAIAANMSSWVDLAIIGIDNSRTAYVSKNVGTGQLANGLPGQLNVANSVDRYTPLISTPQHYIVQPDDIVNGFVTIRLIAKLLYNGSGANANRAILTAANNGLDFSIENKGPMEPLRGGYTLA